MFKAVIVSGLSVTPAEYALSVFAAELLATDLALDGRIWPDFSTEVTIVIFLVEITTTLDAVQARRAKRAN